MRAWPACFPFGATRVADGSVLLREWGTCDAGPLARAVEERRIARLDLIDLITANPNENGFVIPDEQMTRAIASAMAQRSVNIYTPDARGQFSARTAIAKYYGETSAENIVLTPGTSMGYFYALRLLTEPGDEILVPKPGYPLLDDLCAVCGIGMRNYHLKETEKGWALDPDDVQFQVSPRTRAIVVVSPHNPTGMICKEIDYERLGEICRARNLALIVDEVFCEFLQADQQSFPRAQDGDFPLVITLNGFSKMFSIPAWKIAWMKVGGKADRVLRFMAALEHLSDTFLPVNELAQAMVAPLLEGQRGVVDDFAREYRTRMQIARRSSPLPSHAAEAGVYHCMKLPDGVDEDSFVIRLLRDQGVLLHPGYFYGMPGHVIMTCVAKEELLQRGLQRVCDFAKGA
ncbi:pyridoxal phosphate-dependent aminotransferase [Candidatus Sumerlaeota bacterium]|nr:pyridoxal phosphate-dependent aminotransferase [Candidatus Sumerlaeota bacterium]